MITLKDMIELRPYCKVRISNEKNLDFIDMFKYPHLYVVTDMECGCERLGLNVKRIDEAEFDEAELQEIFSE